MYPQQRPNRNIYLYNKNIEKIDKFKLILNTGRHSKGTKKSEKFPVFSILFLVSVSQR